MLLIKNGRVIDPATGLDGQRDILVKDGRILQVKETIADEEIRAASAETDTAGEAAAWDTALKVIDASGMIVCPGLIDTHAHFRDPGFTHKEDIFTGARAAAKGGYTSVILMANTKPSVDSPEVLKGILEKGKKTPIHVYSCANVTRGMAGGELVDMEALKEAGAAGFTDDGVPIMDEGLLKEALIKARDLGMMPVSLHEEDKQYITTNGVNGGGAAAEALGIEGSYREAEISMVRRDVEIGVETMGPLCIQHISTKEGVELVRKARKRNPAIRAEATPHHFSLTEEAVIKKGTLARVNPPLRTEEDRLAIIKGLQDGTLTLIATDHAPHTAEEKAKPIESAPSGMIGLETALSLAIRELVIPGYLTYSEMLRCLTVEPAAFYHLEAGTLAPGAPADITIFDPDETWTVAENFASKASNSPFIGETMPGVVHYTIAGGQIAYEMN